MSLQTKDTFIIWLDEMENRMGWTDYRLSAETGLSSSVFSKARQGILPKWEALVRIADAFNISPITAFRKAGLLPPGPADQINFEGRDPAPARKTKRPAALNYFAGL